MKTIKVVLLVAVIITGIFSGSLYLLSLGVGSGGLGSSYPQRTSLQSNKDEAEIAYKLYQQSCASPATSDQFQKGLSKNQADDCNKSPNTGGISFVGGNGNEMYLLSHDAWDTRVLYATYYLLQRGFDGNEKYSLKMDCSAPGFEKRPKMTLGVHYGLVNGQAKSFIKTIDNPSPNLDLQYVSSGSEKFSPEGSLNNNTANAISPHAYGQALDVYSYGCASVYVRLDSSPEASKWACGYSKAGDTVNEHSYFYPIKNIPLEIGFASNVFTSFSSKPDTNNQPDAYKRYLLDPLPDLVGCSGSDVVKIVDNTCNPPIPPKIPISYKNAGCIAQNQPQGYKSGFVYSSPQGGFSSNGKTSRIQPFQFLFSFRQPTPDGCTCTPSSGVPGTYPESDQAYYQGKTGPLTFVDPNLALSVPVEQKKGLSDDGLKSYLSEQSLVSKKMIIESAMLFSVVKKGTTYQQALDNFNGLVGSSHLPETELTINQISAPNNGNQALPSGYNPFAKLLYGANKNGADYDPAQTTGRSRGLGYNSTDKDRIHLGF